MLPEPQDSIYGNSVPNSEGVDLLEDGFANILKAFENVSWMGELRQRWLEIKKLLKGEVKDAPVVSA